MRFNTRIQSINRSTDNFRRFTREINRYEVMTPEEERAAFDRYRAGDKSVREKIILCNQLFVLSVAKKYSHNSDEILSLVNEGNIGLMKAIDRYDPSRGFKFCSYAVSWITQSIRLYLNYTNRAVRRSNEMGIGRRAEKLRNEFYVTKGRYPSDEEVSDLLMEKYNQKVTDMGDLSECQMTSIDVEVDGYDDAVINYGELARRTCSVNEYETKSEDEGNKEIVSTLMKCLSPRDGEILKRIYGIGCEKMFIDDIAEEFGMCATRVNQIRRDCEKKMGKYVKQIRC